MRSILVVDDHHDVGRALVRLLRHFGFAAEHVVSGEDALARVAQTAFDLVVLDVMMPGIDGIEVLRRLRNDPRTAKVPVAMYSAMAQADVEAQARRLGANDWWPKGGFDYDQLRRRVETLLSKAPSV
jgi:CheY-like chemotaxis protein